MPLVVQGGEIFDGTKLVNSQSASDPTDRAHNENHKEAVREAEQISAHRGGRSPAKVGIRSTAHLVVSLDFEDSEIWRKKIDVEKLRRDLLMRASKAGDVSEVRIEAIMSAPDAELIASHSPRVVVAFPDYPFSSEGNPFPAGSAVIRWPNGKVSAMPRREFERGFERHLKVPSGSDELMPPDINEPPSDIAESEEEQVETGGEI